MNNTHNPKLKKLITSVITLQKNGKYLDAVRVCKGILEQYPNDLTTNELYCSALVQTNRVKECIKHLESLKAITNKSAKLNGLLAIAHKQIGQLSISNDYLDRAIALDPKNPYLLNNRGNLYISLGLYEQAVADFDAALRFKADFPDAWNNKGLAMYNLGLIPDAVICYKRAIQINIHHLASILNLGNIHLQLRDIDSAIEYYCSAIKVEPAFAEAHNNLGKAYKISGRSNDAIQHYSTAIKLKPHYFDAIINLGNLFEEIAEHSHAIECFAKALDIRPNAQWVTGRLLSNKMAICDWADFDEKITSIAAATANNKPMGIPFLFLGLFDCLDLQRKAAELYYTYEVKKTCPSVCNNQRNSFLEGKQKIKIAYLSSDYYPHATMHLFSDVLKLHNRNKFEVVGINLDGSYDPMYSGTDYFDKFIDCSGLCDDDVLKLIRSMNVDIAVDLKGYTKGARPELFSARIAPAQVSFLGYPGTTCIPEMDYIIADEIIIPRYNEKKYSERVVKLPYCYQPNVRIFVNQPNSYSKEMFGLPCDSFVFASFNNQYKINPMMFGIWMNLLISVQQSILWVYTSNISAFANLVIEAKKFGINEHRLIRAEPLAADMHLNRISVSDLILDAFPCNGHTTTSDALRMGVPVLTLCGESFASRVSASLLNCMGMNMLITFTKDDYFKNAQKLAQNQQYYNSVKDTLNDRIANSPLFDPEKFIDSLEKAFVNIYNERCNNPLKSCSSHNSERKMT